MNWLDSYYEAVEFFYWETQHLGRNKHPEAKLDSGASCGLGEPSPVLVPSRRIPRPPAGLPPR